MACSVAGGGAADGRRCGVRPHSRKAVAVGKLDEGMDADRAARLLRPGAGKDFQGCGPVAVWRAKDAEGSLAASRKGRAYGGLQALPACLVGVTVRHVLLAVLALPHRWLNGQHCKPPQTSRALMGSQVACTWPAFVCRRVANGEACACLVAQGVMLAVRVTM